MYVYGLKNCDSCRKAMKAFPQAILVDVRQEGVPDAVLDQASEVFGDALVNTRSTTWRGLDASEREKPRKILLQSHPTLMKRPLIAVEGQLFLSWNKDTEAALQSTLG
ncbi:ArsC/Spx/MgsR family protein [Sulfitobacter aestuariivivens]|uniref:Arsenate reductase n=1 Tax=Sulfitobacter aestuariivivens TaxID=2766981 RepID=A0A927HDW1_9RHOB|nr:ArsC/Spx/MgsR family protein [Sulfitobacter aestuariivivens]MBD3662753.1 arsenate reductase [Sulfitobacter aestuariivivens]